MLSVWVDACLQAILTWHDKAASLLFVLICLTAIALIQLLGLSLVITLALLWQVRPPMLRDPIPPAPANFFMRLPCDGDTLM
jgi:hypothetical protein